MAQPLATSVTPHGRSVVAAWVVAHNDRDLDGMLARMTPGVEFHPLHLPRLESEYSGHDGVREWFGRVAWAGYEHRLEWSELRGNGHGWVVVTGAVSLPELPDFAPFCGTYLLADDLIAAVYHYFSDLDALEHVGAAPD